MSSSASASSPSSTSSRRKVGEIALQKGYINRTQLKEALSAQGELQKLGLSEKIGQILYQKKFITQNVLDEILKEQDAGGGPRRVLGNFEIHEKIGQGAMGVVFKARQISMDRVVALKILSPKYANDAEFIERFVREARAAGQFNHEHIVAAVDVGYVEPYHYFAMEHVQGINLRQAIRERGKLPEREALELTRQVALALDHALSKGIIHRDIKPANIVVEADGVLKVMDFGIARLAVRKPESGVTQAGMIVGTPEYMAPEQVSGGEVDHRVDIYAAGCVLYECLTGRAPLTAETPYQIIAKLLEDMPTSPRAMNPEIPPALEAIIMRTLAKDPAARPQSAVELHDRLAEIG